MTEIRNKRVQAPSGESPSAAEQQVFNDLRSLQVLPGNIEIYGEKVDQFIEWYGPEYGKPVTFVHGGYFHDAVDLSYARPAAFALGEAGYRVALVEYRRLAGHPELTFDDINTLAHHPVLSQSVWLGHSSGGTFALDVLMDDATSVTHAVVLAPLFDLARDAYDRADSGRFEAATFLGGMPSEIPDVYAKYDPQARYAEIGPERFISRELQLDIIHGSLDETVPVQRSKELCTEPFHVAIVSDANHSDLIRPGHDAWLLLLGALGDPAVK